MLQPRQRARCGAAPCLEAAIEPECAIRSRSRPSGSAWRAGQRDLRPWQALAASTGPLSPACARHKQATIPAVAYVKYDKASSAALAMEALNGAVLNNGRGPKLKVLLAEEPTQRCGGARAGRGGGPPHAAAGGPGRRGCRRAGARAVNRPPGAAAAAATAVLRALRPRRVLRRAARARAGLRCGTWERPLQPAADEWRRARLGRVGGGCGGLAAISHARRRAVRSQSPAPCAARGPAARMPVVVARAGSQQLRRRGRRLESARSSNAGGDTRAPRD